jgi:hypothetical protein
MILRLLAIFSPILVGLLPILAMFEKNPGEVWFTDFLLLSVFLILLILVVLIVLFLIKRSFFQASLATILVFLPLSIINESHSYQANVLTWIGGMLGALTFLFITIKTDYLIKIQKAIFVPLLILAFFFSSSIIASKNRIRNTKNELERNLNLSLSELKKTKTPIPISNRDIYFIILDELISPIAFRNYYQYNNERFFSFLKSSGFHLIHHSYSNYPWTIPSISSIASLNYHKNWVAKKEFPQVAHFLLRYNMPAKLLESEGYSTYFIPSIYWFGNPSNGAWSDFLFRMKSYGFAMSVLRSTPLAYPMKEYQRIAHKTHINNQLAQLKEIANKKEGKKFIFTHFLCPHRPIVFDQEGRDLIGEEIAFAEADKKHLYYLNQSYFICQSIQELVQTILASAKTPPIIAIVSDHGKFPIGSSGKGKTTLPLKELSWRLSNFIALHLPSPSLEVPQLMTVGNVFRMLLSHYYGYNLPLLEDVCHTDFFDLERAEPTRSLIPFQTF